jgi:hypothetical protein
LPGLHLGHICVWRIFDPAHRSRFERLSFFHKFFDPIGIQSLEIAGLAG